MSYLASFVLAAAGVTAAISPGQALLIAVSAATITTAIVAAAYAAKRKGELDSTRGAADAWKEERDAEKAKAERLEIENTRLVGDNARLAQMTNLSLLADTLTQLATQSSENHRAVMDHLSRLQELLIPALDRNTEAIRFLASQTITRGM